MKFSPSCKEVVFVEMRNLKSKKGNDFSIVKFADPTTYENVEMIPDDPADFSQLQPGEVIGIEVDISGDYKTLYRTA